MRRACRPALLACLALLCNVPARAEVKLAPDFFERLNVRWRIDRAISDAQHDLATGNAQIYVVGGYSPVTPGISDEERARLSMLPTNSDDVGCMTPRPDSPDSGSEEYARRYNSYIAAHYVPLPAAPVTSAGHNAAP
ncbi:hypothetical protein SAMN02745857_00889 [Andreprevotia lacus DSM 23236]|jgi:hypothetical protein|uniref:Uncharacterized protein n=2 Tax=Andreprevotia TaxID=397275 RepID=A0A1W1X8Y0_9NEIS|nr:hypothetical protein SAMN02745857_00889 [Andreprevotia lacus DSM 23236]